MADQDVQSLLVIALGMVFVGALGLWALARLLALLASVAVPSFAKQGAWQANVQQYAVFVKRLSDEFFGSGPLKITLEHILLFAILLVLVGLWRASAPPKAAKASKPAASAAKARPAAPAEAD